MRKIFYNSLGTEEMYGLIRAIIPEGFSLITLDTDNDIERCDKIADCEVAIVAAKPLSAAVLDAAKNLQLVHHQGVGYHDTVDTGALKIRGIRLALTPSGTTIGVAEHTVLLALAAAKRLSFADSELRQGRWHINSLRPVSVELYGKTVGYIGFGSIAQATAERMRFFGTTGLYFDPYAAENLERDNQLGVKRSTFEALLASADIISIHTPLTAETHHLIGATEFRQMKPTAIVINTARGPVIEQDALASALRTGEILAAGIDVFEHEPVMPDNPLCSLDNVILTPHISAGTIDALRGKMRALFTNVEKFFNNESIDHEVELS